MAILLIFSEGSPRLLHAEQSDPIALSWLAALRVHSSAPAQTVPTHTEG